MRFAHRGVAVGQQGPVEHRLEQVRGFPGGPGRGPARRLVLLLRAARGQDIDGRATLYLVLALRDRYRLLACPADARALTIWGERLLALGLQPRSA